MSNFLQFALTERYIAGRGPMPIGGNWLNPEVEPATVHAPASTT